MRYLLLTPHVSLASVVVSRCKDMVVASEDFKSEDAPLGFKSSFPKSEN